MNKTYFDSENFPGYESSGHLVRTIKVNELIDLIHKIIPNLSIGFILELADLKNFFDGLIPSGKVYDEKTIKVGEDLYDLSLIKFIFSMERAKTKGKTDGKGSQLTSLKITLQKLLQKPTPTDIPLPLFIERFGVEFTRPGTIFTALFRNQPHVLVPLIEKTLKAITLNDLFQIAFLSNVLKLKYPGPFASNICAGINADRITLIAAIEKLRVELFPETDIVFFQNDKLMQEWQTIDKPCFQFFEDKLEDKLTSNNQLCASIPGYCIETMPINSLVSLTKKMISEVSLHDFIEYNDNDSNQISSEKNLKHQGFYDVAMNYPKNHPEFCKLKFVLRSLHMEIEDLKPHSETTGVEKGPFYLNQSYIANLLKSVKLNTVLKLIMNLNYYPLSLDMTFTDSKISRLLRRSFESKKIELGDLFTLLRGKMQSTRTLLEEFPDMFKVQDEIQ